jgi:hypothetical protein
MYVDDACSRQAIHRRVLAISHLHSHPILNRHSLLDPLPINRQDRVPLILRMDHQPMRLVPLDLVAIHQLDPPPILAHRPRMHRLGLLVIRKRHLVADIIRCSRQLQMLQILILEWLSRLLEERTNPLREDMLSLLEDTRLVLADMHHKWEVMRRHLGDTHPRPVVIHLLLVVINLGPVVIRIKHMRKI